MPTTPTYGLPYPSGTDRVMDGDDAIKALAEAIEIKIFKAGRTAATTDASGNLIVAHGLGVVPRVVIGTVETAGASTWIMQVYRAGVTSTNINFVIRDHAGATPVVQTITVNWLVFA